MQIRSHLCVPGIGAWISFGEPFCSLPQVSTQNLSWVPTTPKPDSPSLASMGSLCICHLFPSAVTVCSALGPVIWTPSSWDSLAFSLPAGFSQWEVLAEHWRGMSSWVLSTEKMSKPVRNLYKNLSEPNWGSMPKTKISNAAENDSCSFFYAFLELRSECTEEYLKVGESKVGIVLQAS